MIKHYKKIKKETKTLMINIPLLFLDENYNEKFLEVLFFFMKMVMK
jgi:hypothetical protein